MRNKVIISRDAYPEVIEYIRTKNREVILFDPLDNVADPVKGHPDLLYCPLDSDILFEGDRKLLKREYPGDVRYNGFSTGKYYIHNLSYTDPCLMDSVRSMGLIPVDVKQGYSNCSIVPVDCDSVITYDRGIAASCEKAGMKVLLTVPGHVELPGYDTGFLGGASGLLDDEVIFNGDLSQHPDFERIKSFIEERGLRVKYFDDHPLRDIGSII